MKKQLLMLFTALLVGVNSYAQISYQKGYYINNSGEKIEGLIKNLEWLNNPKTIEFKSSENANAQTLSIDNVKEFRVYNFSKYERYTIDMDRSSDFLQDLSRERNPNFASETLFLRLEVEGEAMLYSYTEGSLKRFFFKTASSEIKQLIYKRYYVTDDQVGKNNQYQQQLLQNLKCSEISLRKIERLEYKVNKLSALFIKYNQCKNPNYTVKKSSSKLNFNVSIRPGVTFSSVDARRAVSLNSFNYEGGSATGFRFGAEMEFIMKFNRNKWAFIVEPTYQLSKATDIRRDRQTNITPGTESIDVEYNSIQLPLGIRHYMFLSENSSIFINASYSLRLGSKDYTVVRPSTGNVLEEVKKTLSDFKFGIGYKYKRYSVEARYGQEQSVATLGSWAVENNMASLIIGYKIF